MRVIYIDVLFFINTAANYLILLATAKICDVSASRLVMAASAVLGGLYSIFSAVPGWEFLTLFPIKLAAAAIMLLVTFWHRPGLLRIAVVFFAVSAAFGGVLFAIASGGVHIGIKILIAVFIAAWALVTLVFRRVGRADSPAAVSLEISCFGKQCRCTALVDTGNSLKDPTTGRAAAIVSQDRIAELFPKELSALISDRQPAEAMLSLSGTEYSGKFRLLPYNSVGVKSGMLLALRPDYISVNGTPMSGMLAAVSPTPVSDGGAYSALVGTDSLNYRRSV